MMRKNNDRNNRNNNGGMKHRNNGGGSGGRRYSNNNGGGNRGANDGQNIARQKHHATQQLGKYGDLARNAQINGDRVDVEYYLQHVDHYTRVLTDIASIEAERYAHQREQQIIPGGPNDPNANQHQDAGESHASPQENSSEPAAADASAPQQQEQQPRQPRSQRQPRRPYQAPAAAPAAEDATDSSATNNSGGDIPLPDSILPPI